MGLGFDLKEAMTGTFHLFDDPLEDHVLRITVKLAVDGLRRFARERRILAEGTLFAEGLAENGGAGRSVTGTVTWKLPDQNRVPYELSFEADDGRRYQLRGQRDFFMYDVVGSLTNLHASLYDDAGQEVGRAVLSFEPRIELPALLKTFRPRLRLRRKKT